MSAKADLLRISRILTSTPLTNNSLCRKRSTWRRAPAGIVHRRSSAVHHPPDARNIRCNSSSEQSGPASSKMKRHRHSAEEQVLVRVRPSARRNGVHLAVDLAYRILDRAPLESLDVCHPHGRIEGDLIYKQGGIDDVYPVIGVVPTSHECKGGLTAYQSNLDIDAVDQEFIMQKEIHVETAHYIDDPTP